jgi:3D (Asp-Asp-Asp) domain-containing protein
MPSQVAALLIVTLVALPAWSRVRRVKPRVMRMEATAFDQGRKPTASGTFPHQGIAAADPAVLPLGSRIRVTGAGAYSGTYTVTDTGSKINGRHIDLYVPSAARARAFGKRIVLVRLLETGKGKQDARDKDVPAPRSTRGE